MLIRVDGKRRLEFREKAKEADRIFGDKKKDMIYGNLMGTDPQIQGRGFATAMLAFCGELVRPLGRHCYVS